MQLEPQEKDGDSSVSAVSDTKNVHDDEWQPKPLTRRSRTGSWMFDKALQLMGSLSAGCPSLPEEDLEAVKHLEGAKDELYTVITGEGEKLPCHHIAWNWHCRQLERHASPLWNSLIMGVLAGISADPCSHSIAWKVKLYTVLAVIARGLKNDGEVTLPGLVQLLRSHKLLNEGVEQSAIHMVFQMIGWICAIWDPLPTAFGEELRLVDQGATLRRRRMGAVRRITIPISETTYQGVRRVANVFGNLLPTPELGLEDDWARDVEAAWITKAYLSFHSLEGLVNVKIKWTRTLAQHLEYDPQKKWLYVFQHPSVCLLMYRDDGNTLLSQLFQCERSEAEEQGRQTSINGPRFEDFLLEVLQSYQLIFGAHKRSRKSVERHLARFFTGTGDQEECDPLLKMLCTTEARSEEVRQFYEELEVMHFDHYVSISEFPFLARKLLNLQRISMSHNPSTIRRLWNDRRNPNNWFALWAVLLLCVGGLVFQALQFIFQVLQVYPPKH